MIEQYADQILGAALAGAGVVASAAAAWVYRRATEWWHRPNVVIEVGNQDGCVYENVLIKNFSSGGSVTSTSRDAIFVRARVTNKEERSGRPDKAEGCIGYLAGMDRWDAQAADFVPTNYQDFLRLGWSFNYETIGMDLLPGIPNWLDICYVLPPKLSTVPELTAEEKKSRTMWSPPQPRPTMEPPVLKLASNPPVHRYGGGFELPGMYRITVQVSGKNFGAKSLQFYLLVPAGSVRPEILDENSWRARLPVLLTAAQRRSNFPTGRMRDGRSGLHP
jgi:hypothetical protein